MTEETTSAQPQEPESAQKAPESDNKLNAKAVWAGVGIGSAALVAALMYATKRPKRRS